MSDKMIKLLSTFFYIGNFPVAPGSLASLATLFICIILSSNVIFYLAFLALSIIVGFKVSGEMEAILGSKDPGCIVIDEVAGMMLTFLFVPLSIPVLFVGFFLFRAFDMFKIYPTCKFEKLEGATGIMMDDIVAGIYANITLQLALRLAGII